MDVSIMIEGQDGLTWDRWKGLAAAVDEAGFAGLFRSDHFTNPQPPDQASLEMIVSLTYLADRTSRIHFGQLVSPVTFRDPVMLTRQAAALDALSGGRMILGLGAGWQEREHRAFGYPLGDVGERMARFEEGLEIASRLLHTDGPASFDGQYFRLHEAQLHQPVSKTGGPPILVGGNGPRRTLPLVARFADIWNGVFPRPDEFRERSQSLDSLLKEQGRPANAVRRTMMDGLVFGRDMADLDQRLSWRHENAEFKGKSLEATIAKFREDHPIIIGTPDEIVDQLGQYADAGVEEIMLQWGDFDDIEGLQSFASLILPRVSNKGSSQSA